MKSTSSCDADIAGDPIWSRSNLTPLTSYCQVSASLSTVDSPASITGLFTESRYVQSHRYTFSLSPPCSFLILSSLIAILILFPLLLLSSSQWWMYLQIFLPSFVLSQLYNWAARVSVSRVSGPRVRWNWSHYTGITATSASQWRELQSSKVNIDIVLSPLSGSLGPYKILITRTE